MQVGTDTLVYSAQKKAIEDAVKANRAKIAKKKTEDDDEFFTGVDRGEEDTNFIIEELKKEKV